MSVNSVNGQQVIVKNPNAPKKGAGIGFGVGAATGALGGVAMEAGMQHYLLSNPDAASAVKQAMQQGQKIGLFGKNTEKLLKFFEGGKINKNMIAKSGLLFGAILGVVGLTIGALIGLARKSKTVVTTQN